MRKFIFKSFILGSPVLFFLIVINYFGDAANLFYKSGYEQKVVKMLLENNNVTNISNYDERILQEIWIKKMEVQPDVVVIGSSRTLLINSSYFADDKMINNSVSGGSLEDIIAIYQIYKEEDKLPKKFILGIDPWSFNENNNLDRWKSLDSYYYSYIDEGKELGNAGFQYKQLISLSYFQNSLERLLSLVNGSSLPVPAEEPLNLTLTKLTDGSIVYGKEFREASIEKVGDKARSYVSGEIYAIEDFKSMSIKSWNDFKGLINEMKRSNIEVELFLAPYHPYVYKRIENEYKTVLEVEKKIREFSRAKDIMMYGSYNPAKAGLDENDFYDGMHLNRKAVKKLYLSK